MLHHRPSAFLLLSLLAGFAFPAATTATTDNPRVSGSYGRLPLHFEANQGQTHKDVRFLSRGSGYSLYLTAGEALLVLSTPNPDAKRDRRTTPAQPDTKVQMKTAALRMSLVGAARKPVVSGLDELPGKANYFIGKDPAKWRTNVPTYAKVYYQNVYPGIDLLYYGNQRQLEHDFVVAPGADPKKIVLGFRGMDKLEIDTQGDLVLHTAQGDIRQKRPVVYQEIDGVRHEIDGGYVRKSANRVGFKVAAYDRSQPLVIDPILAYSTYLGGSREEPFSVTGNGDDLGRGIAVDTAGNAYVTGYTGSHHFPTTAGAFQPTFGGGQYDAFVTKLDPTGSALVYSTYLGGNGGIYGIGIAVDAAGNAYVTGAASADFPTTPGAFQTAFAGGFGLDAFVTKLNPTGSALVYSTYLGGSGSDSSRGIAVDADGNAYVTGYAGPGFPTTPAAFQPAYGGGNEGDAFVAKLNPAGSALVYSTFLGGSSGESANGIAVDADGNAYVTGSTNSTNFPTTAGAFQPRLNQGLCRAYSGQVPCSDVFVTKLDATGSAMIYSTYLGGTLGEGSSGIAVDASGNAYVAGVTDSTNFPTTAGAFQPRISDRSTCFDPYTGGYVPCAYNDAFVTKLDPTGSALVYSTYLGDNSSSVGGIAVDAAGNAYVTGSTSSPNFPTTPGTLQSTLRVAPDAFVTKLHPSGSALVYSTYLGGGNYDGGSGIAVDAAGSAYVTGYTNGDFPTTAGAFQTAHSAPTGSPDAFVAKIVHNRSEDSAATYDGYWPTYGAETGTFSDGTIVASNQATATATFSFTGTAVSWIGVKCNVCGIATVSIDGGAAAAVDTAGPGVPGSLISEPVFSASGLAPDVAHTVVITVTGTTASGNAHIAVDAFDVTR